MNARDVALAFLIVVTWALSFSAVKIALTSIPPLLLCAVRLFLSSVPWVFWVKRPRVSFWQLASYGTMMFTLQLGFLAYGMHLGASPGVAAIVLQTHVFFTIGLAAAVLGEKTSPWQLAGAVVAFSGVACLGYKLGLAGGISSVLLIFLAASSWGGANLIIRKLGQVSALPLAVWSSFVAWPVLLAFSLLLEGPEGAVDAVLNSSWRELAATAYMAYPVTLVAFALWSKLLGRYPASTVAPFTLFVPAVAAVASSLALNEPIPAWKVLAFGLVLLGLCVNLFGARAWKRGAAAFSR